MTKSVSEMIREDVEEPMIDQLDVEGFKTALANEWMAAKDARTRALLLEVYKAVCAEEPGDD